MRRGDVRRGQWAAIVGESRSSKFSRYKRQVWYAQVVEEDGDAIVVRYAIKRPRTAARVSKTLHRAPKEAIIEYVDNIAERLEWTFKDGVDLLCTAAACIL